MRRYLWLSDFLKLGKNVCAQNYSCPLARDWLSEVSRGEHHIEEVLDKSEEIVESIIRHNQRKQVGEKHVVSRMTMQFNTTITDLSFISVDVLGGMYRQRHRDREYKGRPAHVGVLNVYSNLMVADKPYRRQAIYKALSKSQY